MNQVVIKEINEDDYNFFVIVLYVVLKKLDMSKKTDELKLKVKLEKKNKEKVKKLSSPSHGAGVFDTSVGTAADLFVHHGIPWMAKKSVEMGRYRLSQAMRNPNLKKSC